MPTTPRAIAHIGITVPDLEAGVAWYQDVLGFQLIAPPGEVDVTVDSHFARVSREIVGSDCKRFKLAHLVAANGVAIEMFEWVDPATEIPEDNFHYRQQGIFHFAVVDPDVAGLVRRIEETGGKARTRIFDLFEGQPYQFVYCEDPFGTIFEVYSHSHTQSLANQG